jgi:UDP-2,3-diacylglucosamine pyrophosphatase LpxH
MSNLFKKAAVLTDIHFGLKSNSQTHNDDCLSFVKWFIETANAEGCDTCFVTGDWHNNRASINIVTLNYSLTALELLGRSFDRVFFIPGNHDLYYRDRRDIQSAEWARHIPNIEIVNDFYTEGDVSIVPWLVGDDHKKLGKIEAKYMFGHFELPHFYMNAMVQMPDHGEIREDAFNGVERVFTGHFHKRQQRGNITYIGNCFPHNYADAGDDERGMMILAWGQEPKYYAWPDQPRYRVYGLSDVLKTPEKLLLPGMHCRVNIDIDITYEESTFIKETFVGTYGLREMTLVPNKNVDLSSDSATGNIAFESVDTIVTNQLTNIASEHYDSKILLDIYRHL